MTYILFKSILNVEANFMYKQVSFLIKVAFLITYFAESVYVRKYFGLDVKAVEEEMNEKSD